MEDLRKAQNGCDDQLRYCGAHGPAIQFPFRLSSQPEHCGYPGFTLSCTDTHDTVFELPISVKLFVKEINYTSQVIQLYDPSHHCFPKQFRGPKLPSSPFQFDVYYDDFIDDYVLFKCSPRAIMNSYRISCLSGPTYHVYGIGRSEMISLADLPISSTKMYNLLSIPYTLLRDDGDHYKVLQLSCSIPKCGHCEAKGKKCRMKKNSSKLQTECFPKDKGIFFSPISTSSVVNLFSFQANSCIDI
jgi:hypothetical protein